MAPGWVGTTRKSSCQTPGAKLAVDPAQESRISCVVIGMSHRFGRICRSGSPRGRVPRWSLGAGLAAGLLLAVPASGLAATDALDQTIPAGTVPNQINSTKVMAQTFTAGTTGQLDKVSLALETHSNLVTGWLEIRTVGATGSPNGGTQWPATLTPIQITYPFGNPLHNFAISPAFPVTQGTQYAIVWTTKVGNAFWWGNTFDTYSGGQQLLACQGCAWTASPTRDLAFQTWVVTNVIIPNGPPAVGGDHAAVSANEGSPAANTGTFSDPDGDNVTLAASSGSVTKTGAGTWAWAAPATDEAGMRSITITADDGHGHTSSTPFNVTVVGAAPVARVSAATTSSPEGTPVSLSGNATSPSAEDNAAGFNYGWTVTKNGITYPASGSGTSGRWHFTPDDNGTYAVSVRATDDGNMWDTASVTVNVFNVPPTITSFSAGTTTSLVKTPDETLGFSGTFTDPGTADTHTYQWQFGDSASSSVLSTTHSYNAAGTYHVSLTVRDKDGGSDVATGTVIVQSPQEALGSIADYVNAISTLTKGQKNSLIAKLNAASASAARGDSNASHNQMSAFLNEVRSDLKTGKISSGQEAALTTAIHAVEAALGTYNRMLQWWPLEP